MIPSPCIPRSAHLMAYISHVFCFIRPRFSILHVVRSNLRLRHWKLVFFFTNSGFVSNDQWTCHHFPPYTHTSTTTRGCLLRMPVEDARRGCPSRMPVEDARWGCPLEGCLHEHRCYTRMSPHGKIYDIAPTLDDAPPLSNQSPLTMTTSYRNDPLTATISFLYCSGCHGTDIVTVLKHVTLRIYYILYYIVTAILLIHSLDLVRVLLLRNQTSLTNSPL